MDKKTQFRRVIVMPDEPTNARQLSTSTSKNILRPRHPPFFITFVSIFQLCTFVYYTLRSEQQLALFDPVPFQSKLIFNPYRRYEVWRYLTYMFIHAGYWHITFNLLFQLAIGIPLEMVHNFNPVFIIYTGGIVAGALGNSIVDPHSYLAGASSGCYALITAHIANLLINWNEIRGAAFRLATLLVFTFTDFGSAIYERHFRRDVSIAYKISYGGHVAGAVSGLLLGIIFLRNAKVLHWESEAKRWASVIYLGAILYAIVFSLTNPDHFPQPDRKDLIWSQSPFGYQRE